MVGSLPKTTDSRQGFDAIAEHFPHGEFAPAVVLLQLPESTDLASTPHLRALAELQDQLLALDSVDRTRSILDPIGDGTTDAFRVPTQLDQISASLLAPTAGGERTPAQQANEAVSQVGVIERYVEELAAAFPDVAQGAQFSPNPGSAREFLHAAADLRTQAHPTHAVAANGTTIAPASAKPRSNHSCRFSRFGRRLPSGIVRSFSGCNCAAGLRRSNTTSRGCPAIRAERGCVFQSLYATAFGAAISVSGTVGGIATNLDQLAGFFDDRPDAAFLPSDLAAQQGEQNLLGGATKDLAEAFSALRGAFSAYPHPYLIPRTLPGVEEASEAIAPSSLRGQDDNSLFRHSRGRSVECGSNLNSRQDT